MSTRSIQGSARRLGILVAAVAIVLSAVGAVRLAAAWRVEAAPLVETPVSVDSLRARAADEAARAETLRGEIDGLELQIAAMRSAINAADTRVADDAADAEQLRASLDTARRRLTDLEQQLDAARIRTSSAASGPAARSAPRGDDDEHEEHEDEEEEDD